MPLMRWDADAGYRRFNIQSAIKMTLIKAGI